MKTKRAFHLLFGMMLWALLAAPLSANELAGNASPYLAMHGHDPVNWRLWNRKTLSEARRQGKLLFVSIGYFACRWCHVMQHESYQDKKVAAILNRDFISVKVDRELNPVLDERLIDFVQATAGRAGWPLNVFLTPEGYPVAGMTYLPRDRFIAVLNGIREQWRNNRNKLTQAAKEVDSLLAVAQAGDNAGVDKPLAAFMDRVVSDGMQMADTLGGGFGQQTKFPMAPQLAALLQAETAAPDPALAEFLELTLTKMARRGLFDHVGGGFFRYSTDPNWETPHYEKMLYTSALLAPIYLRAAERFGRPDFRRTALRSLDFILDELAAPGGGFIASLSAVDGHGEEGGYYLWRQADLKPVFPGERLDFVNAVWDMLREPHPAAGVLPLEDFDRAQILKVFALDESQLEKRLESVRARLKQVRESQRKAPRDDKRLAGWNGLTLAALAAAAPADDRYRRAGKRLAAFIRQSLWRDGRVVKGLDRSGRVMGDGVLFDYAGVAWGLAAWANLTGDAAVWADARAVVASAWKRFHTDQGWRQTEVDLLPNPVYQRHIRDSALPSPESLLVRATAVVLRHRKERTLQRQLDTLLATASKGVENDPFYFASLIAAAAQVQ